MKSSAQRLALGLALPVLALLGSSHAASQPYASLAFGQAEADLNDNSDSSAYFSVGLGYQATPNLALELNYNDFGEVEEGPLEIKASSFSTAVKGILPLGASFSLYGKLGVEAWQADFEPNQQEFDDQGASLFVGLGASYDINTFTVVDLGYQRHDFDEIEYQVIRIGVALHF